MKQFSLLSALLLAATLNFAQLKPADPSLIPALVPGKSNMSASPASQLKPNITVSQPATVTYKTNADIDSVVFDSTFVGPALLTGDWSFDFITYTADGSNYGYQGGWRDTILSSYLILRDNGTPVPDTIFINLQPLQSAQRFNFSANGYDSLTLDGVLFPRYDVFISGAPAQRAILINSDAAAAPAPGNRDSLIFFVRRGLNETFLNENIVIPTFVSEPAEREGFFRPSSLNSPFEIEGNIAMFDDPLLITGLFNAGLFIGYEFQTIGRTIVDSFALATNDLFAAPLAGNGENRLVSFFEQIEENADTSEGYRWLPDNLAAGLNPSPDVNLLLVPILTFKRDTTPTARGELQSNGLTVFEAYPNPAASTLNTVFQLEEAGNALVQLYDLNGRLVQTQELRNLPANVEQTVSLDVTDLPNGTYLNAIVTNQGSVATRVIVQR